MNNIEMIYLDLDGTVYDQHNGLVEAMNERISRYGREVVKLPQKVLDGYYKNYGSTLRGLQLHYQVDATEYLSYVHDVDLGRFLQPDPHLRAALRALPQPKWIFTNSWRPHAERTLEALGIADLFEGILDTQVMDYEAKPHPSVYRRAMQLSGNPDPRSCLFVEDSLSNLWPAWELGWSTVWVGRHFQQPLYVDRIIRSLHQLPDVVPQPLPVRQWAFA